jgi:UDP-sugar pyrophosphorylase
VAALLDNDARIARVDGDVYAVDCKPHGHGDVHSLLHSTGGWWVWWAGGCWGALHFKGAVACVRLFGRPSQVMVGIGRNELTD